MGVEIQKPRWGKHALKKVIEYKFNDEGNRVKITTSNRVRKLANTQLSKRAVETRSCAKFDDAVHDDAVHGDPLAQMSKGGAVFMVCRTCGKKGDHWTSKCPYKDLAQPTPADSSSICLFPPFKVYVPPNMRRRIYEHSVRVNNLSEDTREPDLMELFRQFGSVSRVYVAMDKKTGMSRGFGFVNFLRREEGEKAIAKLNGYVYDNLILSVEWAAPRAD
ncbi:uncharacterized protein [Rutidosis leptorrhynchoides]|uniref:uncharacterized protein n=1 Tax=Rutidosis leptorrhynchoides TaxID=125765 RepID=UPI003A991358